jgi:hypothetical protein
MLNIFNIMDFELDLGILKAGTNYFFLSGWLYNITHILISYFINVNCRTMYIYFYIITIN